MCGDDIKNDPDQHQTCATSRLSISIYILYVNHRKSRKLFKYLHKLIIKIQHDTDPRLYERDTQICSEPSNVDLECFFSLQVPDTRHKYPILDTSRFSCAFIVNYGKYGMFRIHSAKITRNTT